MKTFLTISALLALSLNCIGADKPAAADKRGKGKERTAEAKEDASTEERSTVELKNKSSFTMDSSGRNPFWPIGFKPIAKVSKGEHTGPDILPSAFVVTSITLGQGERLAIINGKILVEGQQFGLAVGGQVYQVTVKAIEDGRVIMSRRDQEIIVPLRRK